MRTTTLALLSLAAVACASAGESGAGPRDSTVVTTQEIDESTQTNAYDLVRTLRPGWLRVRGTNSILQSNPVSVYVDGMRRGGPESLRSIPRLNIRDMRFYNASEAQLKFGLGNTNGAIAIRTRRG